MQSRVDRGENTVRAVSKTTLDHNMKGQVGDGCSWINIRRSRRETENLSIEVL